MLVSVCIKCYNQERYIRAALEAAFAQTYNGDMEIIVADDASSDESAKIIQSCISDYRTIGGKRHVVFIRNEKNLGNIGNWQALCKAASGDILVKMDGDDISMPNRVERIVANWDRNTKCLVHAAETMDLDGNTTGMFEKADGCFGAGSAYSRDTFSSFGDVEHAAAADDEVYLWRAKMLGEVKQIDERLVRYRIGSGFSSITYDFRRRMYDNYVRTLESRRQTLKDVCRLPEADAQKWRPIVAEAERKEAAMVLLWSDAPIAQRLRAYANCERGRIGTKAWAVRLLQILPRRLSDGLVNHLAAARNRFR